MSRCMRALLAVMAVGCILTTTSIVQGADEGELVANVSGRSPDSSVTFASTAPPSIGSPESNVAQSQGAPTIGASGAESYAAIGAHCPPLTDVDK